MKNIATFNIQGTAVNPPCRYKDFDATLLMVRTNYNGSTKDYPVVAWGQNQGILRSICAGQSVYIEGLLNSRVTDKGIFVDLRATAAYVAPDAEAAAAQAVQEDRARRAATQPARPARGRGYEEADEDIPF